MSQKTEILEDLQNGHQITQLDAITEYGCYRLASRINDLRGEGHEISTTMITVQSRRGETKVAKYSYVD